jgi:hypothetical protein
MLYYPPAPPDHSKVVWTSSQGTFRKNKPRRNRRQEVRLKNKALKRFLKNHGISKRVKTHLSTHPTMIAWVQFHKEYYEISRN